MGNITEQLVKTYIRDEYRGLRIRLDGDRLWSLKQEISSLIAGEAIMGVGEAHAP